MKAYERFLKYVSVWTTSDETSETVPSADRELVLAELLVEEMKELGIEDARVDEKGYVYGSVPATLGCENAPALGLIAHMDTAPDAPGDNIHPQIIDFFLNDGFCLFHRHLILFPHLSASCLYLFYYTPEPRKKILLRHIL